jgi:methionine-rich copper-binding protein CopC
LFSVSSFAPRQQELTRDSITQAQQRGALCPRQARSRSIFTEQLEPKFSGAEVRNADGERVDRGSSISGKVMHVSIGALPPGTYNVSWHVLSVDTHKTQASFSFTVGK